MNLRLGTTLALVLALAGCPKGSSDPVAEPEEQPIPCDAVADRAVALLQQDGEIPAGREGPLRDTLVELCTADEWPQPARSCIVDADDHRQLQDCAHQYLSDDAYRRVGEQMERALDESDDGTIGLPPE